MSRLLAEAAVRRRATGGCRRPRTPGCERRQCCARHLSPASSVREDRRAPTPPAPTTASLVAVAALALPAFVLAAAPTGAEPGADPLRFAGPRETPFFCESSEFRTADGSMLPAAPHRPRSARCRPRWTTSTARRPAVPAAPQRRCASDGRRVHEAMERGVTPYVVRVQTGTVNRGMYEMAILHDPATSSAPRPPAQPRLEWPADLHVGRRLSRRLVSAGAEYGRRSWTRCSRAGSRWRRTR